MGKTGSRRHSFWLLTLLAVVGLLIQACSDNKGPAGPTFGAGHTGVTELAIFPTEVTITQVNEGGKCRTRLKFTATGGVPPYTFVTSFSSAGVPSGGSKIDSSGVYTATLDAGFVLSPDTILVTDAVGDTVTATVNFTCT